MDYNLHQERFYNFETLLNACDSRRVNNWARDGNRQHGEHWAGDTYERGRELLVNGDAESVKKITPARLDAIASVRPQTRAAVVGTTAIVPAAIIGLPKAMKRREKTRSDDKVITLVVNIGYSCGVDAETVAERGRELCAFIQAAERAGYRIALDVCANFAESDEIDAYFVRVNVKRAEQSLNIKRLCYPLIHASMFRQLLFDWYERYPNARHISGYGVSFAYWNKTARDKILAQALKRNEHYFDLIDFTDYKSLLERGL